MDGGGAAAGVLPTTTKLTMIGTVGTDPPRASLNGVNPVGTIESVKFCSDLVFVLSVNFSENTSVMSFCISGDKGASVWLKIPFAILICKPALSTTASGVSVVLSNRM